MKITSDIHIHTSLSSCAERDATFEEYVERAGKDGLTALGFSDHLWDSDVPGASNWYAPQNVGHVLELKAKLPADRVRNGVRLLYGCETEFTCERKLCLAEEHMDLFDYILVPHSHMHMRIVVPPERIPDYPSQAKYMMDSFLWVVEHPLAHRITAIAHPFVVGTRHATYNDVQKLIPDSYFREAFSAAKEKGIAIEMNGSCLIYLPEERIPTCEYVRIYSIAKECGCRFTYGSDSHSARGDRMISVVERFFDQCGITEDDLLTPDEILNQKGIRKRG